MPALDGFVVASTWLTDRDGNASDDAQAIADFKSRWRRIGALWIELEIGRSNSLFVCGMTPRFGRIPGWPQEMRGARSTRWNSAKRYTLQAE
ncbi:MAG: hypothetical protein R3D80_11555 [Paracoccaceae bacterium]